MLLKLNPILILLFHATIQSRINIDGSIDEEIQSSSESNGSEHQKLIISVKISDLDDIESFEQTEHNKSTPKESQSEGPMESNYVFASWELKLGEFGSKLDSVISQNTAFNQKKTLSSKFVQKKSSEEYKTHSISQDLFTVSQDCLDTDMEHHDDCLETYDLASRVLRENNYENVDIESTVENYFEPLLGSESEPHETEQNPQVKGMNKITDFESGDEIAICGLSKTSESEEIREINIESRNLSKSIHSNKSKILYTEDVDVKLIHNNIHLLISKKMEDTENFKEEKLIEAEIAEVILLENKSDIFEEMDDCESASASMKKTNENSGIQFDAEIINGAKDSIDDRLDFVTSAHNRTEAININQNHPTDSLETKISNRVCCCLNKKIAAGIACIGGSVFCVATGASDLCTEAMSNTFSTYVHEALGETMVEYIENANESTLDFSL